MAKLGKLLLEKEILLESGTNELEILVFRVANHTFGINVAKVREVLPAQRLVSLPRAHASVLGVFKLRDRVIPCVSLCRHLNITSEQLAESRVFILTEFNGHQTAFEVDHVERIHRLSWQQVLPAPSIMSLSHTPVTSVARINERLVTMLDFEMISDQVTNQMRDASAVANVLGLPREDLRIVLADDSPTVREAMERLLRASGYTNLRFFENGAEAWNFLESEFAAKGDIHEVADLVISDVEMPQIDGLHLCKRIKERPGLADLPVLLYSSIATPDNHKKGLAVGANAQITKPELSRVVELADDLILKFRNSRTTKRIAEQSAGKHEPSPSAASHESAAPVAVPPVNPALKRSETVDPQLWNTFRAELRDRARHLERLGRLFAEGQHLAETMNDLLRTLHTVKSASMVVPVHEISGVTHEFESLLARVRATNGVCPADFLARYTEWLHDLSEPGANVPALLAEGPSLLHSLAFSPPLA